MLSKLNKFFSSVKLAIFLFIAIALLSMVGTFINQGDTMSQYKILFGAKAFSVLYMLGFLNIYGSWYFIGLAILLALNLIVASANILPGTLRAVFGPYPSFKQMMDKKRAKAVYESFESKSDSEKIIKTLNSQFGNPLVSRDGDNPEEKELYYSKNSIFRFSPLIAHASILIIIAGVLLNAKYGFRSSANLKVGEKTNISYLTTNRKAVKLPFTIRLDRYQTKYYPDGIAKSYISKISIIKNHVRVATKNIRVNHPFTYGGITMYQASYGHYKPNKYGILVVDLKNIKSKNIVYAQTGKFYNAGTGNLQFSLNRNPKNTINPYFIQLSNNKIINFIVYRIKNRDFPLVMAKYGNIAFVFTPNVKTYYYSGLQITRNSYVSVIWTGSIILIIALFFSFFFSHREIWVRLSKSGEGKKGMKNKIEILAMPKKKFESFYKNFNKKMESIKKELH